MPVLARNLFTARWIRTGGALASFFGLKFIFGLALIGISSTYLSVAELTIEAALTGSRDLVRQAMLVDPNASSTLTPAALWELTEAMFDAHADVLPTSLGGRVELWLP